MTQRGSTWAVMNGSVADKYGGSWLRPQSASPEATGDMTSLTPQAASGSTGGPSEGLMAIGVVALISFGLMAFATTVRVGKAEAHVGVGKV